MKSTVPLYVIVLMAGLLWGGEYVRRDLWEPDEGRYALVSREMLATGEWFVPHRQGEFYTHKPPLFFWITSLAATMTGGEVGRLAPRIPGFIGAIMALWATSQLANRWFSRQAGWLSVLILASSYLFYSKGGFGQIDALLCGLEMMALYFLFTAHEGHPVRRLVTAYVFMGLGILAKGPVGFAVPLGVYLVASRFHAEAKSISRWHYAWGPLVALSLPALWLFMAWMEGAPTAFFTELLFHQNVGRVTGEFGGHEQPFYYFLKYLPVDFLPWTFLVPLSFTVLRRTPECRKPVFRLLTWMAFVVLFFSLSASKRNLYILLVYPAASMMIAAAVDHWDRVSERWIHNSARCLIGLFTLLGVVVLIIPLVPHYPLHAWSLIPIGLVLLAGARLAFLALKRDLRSPRWLVTSAFTMLAAFALVGVLVQPDFNDLKVPDEIVDPAKRLLGENERIIMYRQHGEMFSLYSGRMGYMAITDERLVEFLRTTRQPHHLIIALEKDLDDLYRIIPRRYEGTPFYMGNKKLVWISIEDGFRP